VVISGGARRAGAGRRAEPCRTAHDTRQNTGAPFGRIGAWHGHYSNNHVASNRLGQLITPATHGKKLLGRVSDRFFITLVEAGLVAAGLLFLLGV
jgi:hypothetical protein